jgi:hypothetical protein
MIRSNVHLQILFAASFILLSSYCFAQPSLSEALGRVPATPAPFEVVRGAKYPNSSGIINPNNVISGRLYDNVQLTQYVSASITPELDAVLSLKFTIPNSNRVLAAISFGHGYGGNKTDVLCVVNPNGTISSTLEGTVMGADVYIKQFRINAQHQVIVTTIKSVSTVSIPLETFTSFSGYRQDITYSVNSQGQFVQVSTQTYPTKTYTRSSLESKSINLWEIYDSTG